MCMVSKRSGNEKNSQNGFVLVSALIAVMILMAVGIFALTTSSQDIKATVRSVSEGNALSAAEAGVHTLCATFTPTGVILALPDRPTTTIQGSPTASFNVVGQVRTDIIDISPGMGWTEGQKFHYDVYNARVTGFENFLNGRVTLQVGIVDITPRASH